MSTAMLVVCGLEASLNLLDVPSKAQDVAVPLVMHLSDFQRNEQGRHNITTWGQLLQLTAATSVGNDLFVKAATGITNATSTVFVVSLIVFPVLGVLLVLVYLTEESGKRSPPQQRRLLGPPTGPDATPPLLQLGGSLQEQLSPSQQQVRQPPSASFLAAPRPSGAVSLGSSSAPSTEQTRADLRETLTGPAAMQQVVPPSPVPASPMPASAYPGVVDRSGRLGGGGGAMGVAQVTQVALSSSGSVAYPHGGGARQVQDSDILCPALVVKQETGVALAINGELRPQPQEEVLEIIQVENQMQAIVRIFVSESGPDRGILLESALQFPIAFLDTSRCSGPRVSGARRVSISRAAPGGVDPSDPSPFAIVEEGRDGTTVYRGQKDGSRGRMLQKVSVVQQATGGHCLSIRDARGADIARAEPRQTIDGLPSLVLHITQGEDSGLAICSVIATVKLNCFDPSRSSLQPAQIF